MNVNKSSCDCLFVASAWHFLGPGFVVILCWPLDCPPMITPNCFSASISSTYSKNWPCLLMVSWWREISTHLVLSSYNLAPTKEKKKESWYVRLCGIWMVLPKVWCSGQIACFFFSLRSTLRVVFWPYLCCSFSNFKCNHHAVLASSVPWAKK